MFRIIEINGKFRVETLKRTRILWVLIREEWTPYEFRGSKPSEFKSYHHALQQLLIDIEIRLNLAYFDAK